MKTRRIIIETTYRVGQRIESCNCLLNGRQGTITYVHQNNELVQVLWDWNGNKTWVETDIIRAI